MDIKKIKAYWLRFWHCLWWTLREPGKDHRMEKEVKSYYPYTPPWKMVNETTYIGCACGRGYYGKKSVEFMMKAPVTYYGPKMTFPDFKHTPPPPPPPKKEVFFKYIIYGEDKRLIMGFSVDYHAQLVPKNGEKSLVRGGGRIAVDDEGKRVLFYALSTEFDDADRQELVDSMPNTMFSPSWEGYKVYYAKPTVILQADAWKIAELIYEISE